MNRSTKVACLLALFTPFATAAGQTFVGFDFGTGAGGSRVNSDAARAAWLAATGPIYGLVTFEGMASGAFGSMGIGSGITATQTGTSGGITSGDTHQLGYNTTAGGSKFLQHLPATFGGTSSVTLSFAAGTYGFGAYFTGLETFFGTTTVYWSDGGAMSLTMPNTGPGGTSAAGIAFLGINGSSAISSIKFETVSEPSARDIWGMDDIEVAASPVPEPSSIILVASGLVGVMAFSRRRRR